MTTPINFSDVRQLLTFNYPEDTLLFWDTLFLALGSQVLLAYLWAAGIIEGEGAENRILPLIFGSKCLKGTDHFKTWRQL